MTRVSSAFLYTTVTKSRGAVGYEKDEDMERIVC